MSSLAEQVQAKKEAERRSRFGRIRLDEIGEIQSADYLIKHLINRLAFILLYGASGSGKTFLAIYIACAIAAGLPWRDKRTKPGLVVYVAAEAGTSILKRFRACCEECLGDAHESPIALEILTKGADLLDPVSSDSLIQELSEIGNDWGESVALVVIDTLSRSIAGGDENSSSDMTTAISVADRIRDEIGATTMFVHHSGKDLGRGARGHSALFAAADTVLAVSDHAMKIEKSRDDETGTAFGFSLKVIEMGTDEDGEPITTCVAVPTDAPKNTERTPKAPGSATVALQSLQEAILNKGEQLANTSTIPPNTRGVRLDDWRVQFKIRYGEDKADISNRGVNKAFTAGKDWLHKYSKIGVSDSWVWLA